MNRDLTEKVERFYDTKTRPYFMEGWDQKHFHFGIYRGRRLFRLAPPLVYLLRRRAVARMNSKIIGAMDDSVSARVLDAGAGVGGMMEMLHGKFGSESLGLTISSIQVEIGNQNFVQAGLQDSLKLLHADCSKPFPVPDGSFDSVISVEAACHFSDKRTFLHEVRRALRPLGRFVLVDWVRNDDRSHPEYADVLAEAERFWNLDTYSHNQYLSELRELGFTILAEEILHGVAPTGYLFMSGGRNKRAHETTRQAHYAVGRAFAEEVLQENYIVASLDEPG